MTLEPKTEHDAMQDMVRPDSPWKHLNVLSSASSRSPSRLSTKRSAVSAASSCSSSPEGCSDDKRLNSEETSEQRLVSDQIGPVAIIGIACRLPGSVARPSELWDLLINEQHGHSDIPKSRFDASAIYNSDKEAPGAVNTTGGYFLHNDPRRFDNAFFGISDIEATYMDPQQRQLLEAVYECIEDAGVTSISASNTGCYVANFTNDFVNMQAKTPEDFHRFSATGFGTTILSNRISHVFNLQGPSLVVDTACSSSIYALHIACQGLLAGDCDSAFVAGVNLVQSPELHMAMVKAGVLSGTSMSHTFDAAADGYGRGEGVGVLYIKKLSHAIRDNDSIRAVIRATAVNSNGTTPGITLPSANGQEAVIRKAYESAGLSPLDTKYVETHGTGTPVGDPIEVDAISRVFCQETGPVTLLGSIKPNLGHTESVSGIASVIKAVLILENGTIPSTIGISKINPDLKLQERNARIVTSATKWPAEMIPRISVNSFGYGGANAHCIIDSTLLHLPDQDQDQDHSQLPQLTEALYLIPVTATSKHALELRIKQLSKAKESLYDIAYTLGIRRQRFSYRSYLLSNTFSDVVADAAVQRICRTEKPVPFGFVFTGQGAQWPRMGSELFKRYHTYRDSIRMMDKSLCSIKDASDFGVEQILYGSVDEDQIQLARYAQPACTAIQIALVDLLRSWNVCPQTVVGHSSGEIAAAYAAGIITQGEAIAIAYYRGKAVANSHQRGAMLAVGMSRTQALAFIDSMSQGEFVKVACINSSESVTLSGDYDHVLTLMNALTRQGTFVRLLKTNDKAYHSHHMKALSEVYKQSLSFLSDSSVDLDEFYNTNTDMISSVTALPLDAKTVRRPEYWQQNLEQPVDFETALSNALLNDDLYLIEIGPHQALMQPVKSIVSKASKKRSVYASTLSRGKDGEHLLLSLAGSLFISGYDLDFQAINTPPIDNGPARPPQFQRSLPSYPWDHSALLWKESLPSIDSRGRKFPRHDLLGISIDGHKSNHLIWRNAINCKKLPWLSDHQIEGRVVFPAAGYLAMAIEAFNQALVDNSGLATQHNILLKQVKFVNMLAVPEEKTVIEVFTSISPLRISSTQNSQTWWRFSITSSTDGRKTTHATGDISLLAASPKTTKLNIDEEKLEKRSSKFWYNQLAGEGLDFGARFQTLKHVYTDRGNLEGVCSSSTRLQTPDTNTEYSKYILHPTTIDAVLQTGLIASSKGLQTLMKGHLPFEIGYLEISSRKSREDNSPTDCIIRAKASPSGMFNIRMTAELYDTNESRLLYMDQVKLMRFSSSTAARHDSIARTPAMRLIWKPDLTLIDAEDSTRLIEYLDLQWQASDTKHTKLQAYLLSLLGLYSHKKPRLRVLLITEGKTEVNAWISDALMSVVDSYVRASIDENQVLSGFEDTSADRNEQQPLSSCSYDVILLISSSSRLIEQVQSLKQQYSDALSTIAIEPAQNSVAHLALNGSSVLLNDAENEKVLSIWSMVQQTYASDQELYLIQGQSSTDLDNYLLYLMANLPGTSVKTTTLSGVSSIYIKPGSKVIVTAELEKSILCEITSTTIDAIKLLGTTASVMVWLTGGNTFAADDPSRSMVLGLSRSYMIERPNLKWSVVGLESISHDFQTIGRNIVTLLSRLSEESKPDLEYLQSRGLLHISRFNHVPTLNDRFDTIIRQQTVSMTCAQVGSAKLTARQPGRFESICFRQDPPNHVPLLDGWLRIKTTAVSLNAKDYYALNNRIDTKNSTSALEFCGQVLESMNGQFMPGDRVVVMAPSHYGTIEVVPAWACIKLLATERYDDWCTVPMIFSTALYALKYRGYLQPGESVLIHSATGGVGLAAIQIAQNIGATIYATVGTDAKKQYLVETFNIPEKHIFNSRTSGFAAGVQKLTDGAGVDVILNSLTGHLLHENLDCLGEFGRFIEIGKRDILESGNLDMRMFEGSKTFTAFDLTDLYWSKSEAQNQMWSRLLSESMQLVRQGKVNLIEPRVTFPVTDVAQAFRYFGDTNRMGKIVVQYEDSMSMTVLPKVYSTSFQPNKTYLLVGGLGGLGRRITRWMYNQGARSFAFIGPSGDSRPSSKTLIQDLQALGAQATVMRGDVSRAEDIKQLLAQISAPLGGVIHTAMSVHAALFKDQTVDLWQNGITQKVQGCWALHSVLEETGNTELDFFLVLSSISGSVGVATEANYSAANSFLDTFARYRRRQGRAGFSLGLGMIQDIGFMAENSAVEETLLRQGVQPYSEHEMLQLLDMALTPPKMNKVGIFPPELSDVPHEEAHFVVGLEFAGFERLRERGYGRIMQAVNDIRCSKIARYFAEAIEADANPQDGSGEMRVAESSSRKYARYTALVSEITSPSIKAEGMQESLMTLKSLVLPDIAKVLAGLLQMDMKTLTESDTVLAAGGMDSMLAPEARADLFRAFRVEVPFMVIMNPAVTSGDICDFVVNKWVEDAKAFK